MIDSIVAAKNTVKLVRIYTEIGVEKDIIEEIQTYCQERINLDIEDIDVFKNLVLWELLTTLGYFQRDSAYREALQN